MIIKHYGNAIGDLKTKGFTLIELLVVIVIIGFILSIAVASYRSVSMQSRDGKRKSDLEVIRSALERYYADKGCYPPCPINSDYGQYWDKSHQQAWIDNLDYDPNRTDDTHPLGLLKTEGYLAVIPFDPVNQEDISKYGVCNSQKIYVYRVGLYSQANEYTLSAVEEEKGEGGVCPVECSMGAALSQYCISSP